MMGERAAQHLIQNRLLDYLRYHHDVTPASAAKSLGLDRRQVQGELSILVGLGQVSSSVNSLGVTSYRLVEAVVETKPEPRPRSKPFSATRVTGAYVKNGNLTITVNRRLNARSFTISKKDFDVLAQIYGKSGVFGDS
jgi:hypothetical protein